MTRQELANLSPGDHVRMTCEGTAQGIRGRAWTDMGEVLDTQPAAGVLRVRRDGIKGSDWYGIAFWDVAP